MAQAGVVNDSFLCESTKQKLLDHSMSLTKRALRETMDVFSMKLTFHFNNSLTHSHSKPITYKYLKYLDRLIIRQ